MGNPLEVQYQKLGVLGMLGVKTEIFNFLDSKSTSVHQRTHFEILLAQISPWVWPVEMFKKQNQKTLEDVNVAVLGKSFVNRFQCNMASFRQVRRNDACKISSSSVG